MRDQAKVVVVLELPILEGISLLCQFLTCLLLYSEWISIVKEVRLIQVKYKLALSIKHQTEHNHGISQSYCTISHRKHNRPRLYLVSIQCEPEEIPCTLMRNKS